MLRMLSLVLLVSPAMALAQVPPAPPPEPVTEGSEPAPVPAPEPTPATEPAPAAEAAPAAEPAPPAEAELPPEEPPMKKVCRRVEVVGSAIGRTVCTLKPVRAPKPKSE